MFFLDDDIIWRKQNPAVENLFVGNTLYTAKRWLRITLSTPHSLKEAAHKYR